MNGTPKVGLVVDAGPKLGYGHAVRCLRIARILGKTAEIFPLSDTCRTFFEANGFRHAIRNPRFALFPPLVVTDLREAHGISAAIRGQGSTHVSIHDLGLAQCRSDAAIDGSIVQLFPFAHDRSRALFLGPKYMITRAPVARAASDDIVFVTLGGGSSSEHVARIADLLQPLGLRVVSTSGLGHNSRISDAEIEQAMATCRFAISTSGTTLYDLLASGIPTIALAVDRLQLRTAEAFREMGGVLSAGLIDRVTSRDLLGYCQELLLNRPFAEELAAAGRRLVDGKGLSRVAAILRSVLEKNMVPDRACSI